MSTVLFPLGTQAYSYIRFSRPEQLKGDSLRRQLEGSQQWADELRLPLNTELRDLGRSAYSGAHREKGDLGKFLALVDRGEIARGSVLIIESLDRLSRETVLDALQQFTSLIQAGIVIATLADRQIYSRETIGNDWSKLIISLTIMARAHEESAMKAKRLSAAWEKKRRDASTKPMTARCPEWLKYEDGEFKEIRDPDPKKDRVAIVRRILEETVSGLGKWKIAKKLDQDGIPPFRGKDGWHESSIQKIISNEAVIGVCQPHRKVKGQRIPEGDPIPNYYPAIVDEALFWRARSAVGSRRHGAAGRKGKGYPNLMQGLGMCECCGSGLVYVNKGHGPKGGQYLVCSKGRRHLCANRTHYPYPPLEDEILRLVPLINFDAILPPKPNSGDNGVADLEAEIARKTQRLANLLDLEDVDAAKDRIRALDQDIKTLKGRLTEASKAAKAAEHLEEDWLDKLLLTIAALHLATEDDRYVLRSKIAQELRRIIECVSLNSEREIRLLLKPSVGYRAEMHFRDNKFSMLRLTDVDSGEITDIDRFLFLSTMRYALSSDISE
jgi:DNA invertase Pin-like site-specific DNA recombinase